jgi:hypothetical protein
LKKALHFSLNLCYNDDIMKLQQGTLRTNNSRGVLAVAQGLRRRAGSLFPHHGKAEVWDFAGGQLSLSLSLSLSARANR